MTAIGLTFLLREFVVVKIPDTKSFRVVLSLWWGVGGFLLGGSACSGISNIPIHFSLDDCCCYGLVGAVYTVS